MRERVCDIFAVVDRKTLVAKCFVIGRVLIRRGMVGFCGGKTQLTLRTDADIRYVDAKEAVEAGFDITYVYCNECGRSKGCCLGAGAGAGLSGERR